MMTTSGFQFVPEVGKLPSSAEFLRIQLRRTGCETSSSWLNRRFVILPFVFALFVWAIAGTSIAAASLGSDDRGPLAPVEQTDEEKYEESFSEIDALEGAHLTGFFNVEDEGPSIRRWSHFSRDHRGRESVLHQPNVSRAPPSC